MFTFTLFTVIMRFHVLGIVQRLYGVVGRSCDFCAVTVTYSRKSYIDRAIPVQRLCEDRKVKVSSLNATYDVFKGYDLTIWKICITPR